jgi:hypothetical protein
MSSHNFEIIHGVTMPSTGRFDDKRFEFRAKVRVFLLNVV